ncbi:uncharacterized protein LOC129300167 isoform X2 [Prosopis cineraria]|uniref:uncharacterized protein LOC129300167 isoform X2 n=1 Tax=Prosopis cineraria TaxID=364024 RepID=UPI0024108946|nr:uncharacterized protein LOC129300167 isoform X2 [Prosopis cineraria]
MLAIQIYFSAHLTPSFNHPNLQTSSSIPVHPHTFQFQQALQIPAITMASTSRPQKKLSEFLNEEQQPFVLELYLLERGCSRKWNLTQDQGGNGFDIGDSGKSLERSASCVLNKKRKALLSFSEVLTSVYKKLAAHSETPITRDSDNRDEDAVSVPQTERAIQKVVETDRFSSASSSTLFNSCSETGEIEEQTWISSHKDQPSFISDTCSASNACNIAVKSQQATSNEKHRWRYIEQSPALLDRIQSRKVQVSQNNERVKEDVGRREQRILNCGEVVMPKKITEDSLLSAAFWGLLIQSAERDGHSISKDFREILGTNVSQVLKSKRALHKTKQLLFDCVREIAASFPRTGEGQTGFKQLLGAEELGNLICQKTREWGQQAGDRKNLTNLLTSDHLKSINEWSDLEPHMKDISFEVADAILDCINNEIVSEMVDIFPPSI